MQLSRTKNSCRRNFGKWTCLFVRGNKCVISTVAGYGFGNSYCGLDCEIILGQWYFCDIQVGRTGACLL